jgi:arsenite/tail-anchored protein-transporting ATPase
MEIADNKLLLFGGKGGVGKTSCAAATGIHAASIGKKVLVMSTDPAHSLSDSFGIEIGNKVTLVRENLDALEIDPSVLLAEYKSKYGDFIKQIADEGTFFSKEEIQQFFDLSLPGIDELMALFKVNDILEEGKYDLLILDTAPTGHTIRLLELPDLLTSYIKVLGEMRMKHRVVVKMMVGRYLKDKADEFLEEMGTDVARIKALLKDTGKTKFIPVTIPEAMSVYETERLIQTLETHKVSVDTILINRVIKDGCDFCNSRSGNQKKYIQEIETKFSKYVIKKIPLFGSEIKAEGLENLSNIMYSENYDVSKVEMVSSLDSAQSSEVKFDKLVIAKTTQFLLFGGKGGVGKTTMASSSALHISKTKKVLIFSTDPAHSLSDSFGVKIGGKVTSVANNLDALEIDSLALLNNFKQEYRKEINALFDSILSPGRSGFHGTIDIPYDRKVLEDLFDLCPPGIDELMALKTMVDVMDENKYDLFVLDTAPSGHTVRLLEMPEIAEQWLTTLSNIIEQYPIGMDLEKTINDLLFTIQKLRKILCSDKTQFIGVTIAEAMGVLETEDLILSLERLKVPLTHLIVNELIPKSDCDFCSSGRQSQEKYLAKLKLIGLPLIGVVLFDNEIRGEKDLEKLSSIIF